ncbi:hypothetical protein FACS189431_2020 [Alphaproteobacteria bacterium]|nr:hypothetical protein FACS189431_2020 [Alphaproteobacteria bacterium]
MSTLYRTRKEYYESFEGRISAFPIVEVVEDTDTRLAEKFRRDIVKRQRKTAKQQAKLMRWALKGAHHGK